jgi:dTDP-4-dehydrorhamnose reductase
MVVAAPPFDMIGSGGPKVLITGSAGQLGHELIATFGDRVVAAVDRNRLDIADRAAVLDAVMHLRPDVIVNAAAYNAVDGCETKADTAFTVNALGVRHLVDAADRAGSRVVHVSTDYVFSGDDGRPYTEWDATGPKSVYGRSKLAGELELRPSDLCVRTAWLAGAHGSNMVRTVLGLVADGAPLAFVDDQVGSPSFAADLAATLRLLVLAEVHGTYHGANRGQASWYEFVGDILEAAGHSRAMVSPISTADLHPPRPAPRPAYSVLDDMALRLGGFPRLPHYRESLDRLVAELNPR